MKTKKLSLLIVFLAITINVSASPGHGRSVQTEPDGYRTATGIQHHDLYVPRNYRKRTWIGQLFTGEEYVKDNRYYGNTKGPSDGIPLDGGELVFIFMGLLMWVRRESIAGSYKEKNKVLAITKKEYRWYTAVMLVLVTIFMPIGALSKSIYIDMNVVALGWLGIVSLVQFYRKGLLQELRKNRKNEKNISDHDIVPLRHN
ncbi:MAG: hypothetical protein GXP45_01635 [bacterium]|nr:hypothetical protein [bacterium]